MFSLPNMFQRKTPLPPTEAKVSSLVTTTVSKDSFDKLWKLRHSRNFTVVAHALGIATDVEQLQLKEGQVAFELDQFGRRFLHIGHKGFVLTFHDQFGQKDARKTVVYKEPRFPESPFTDIGSARNLLNHTAYLYT
jgi:hypothetical protein